MTLSASVSNEFIADLFSLPYAIGLLVVSKVFIQSKKLFIASIFIVVFAITVNLTQTKNPILYPILHDGYIEVLEDGYLEGFDDGSVSFLKTNDCQVCGSEPNAYKPVYQGDIFKVTGVSYGGCGLHNCIYLKTELGEFHEDDYSGAQPVLKTNKVVRNSWAEEFGGVMYIPVIVLLQLLSG